MKNTNTTVPADHTNLSIVYAEIDSALKERAEGILDRLGIPVSSAVRQFYMQITLYRGIPFEVRLPDRDPKHFCL